MGWVNKASLTLPLFTEVPVPSQESEQSCVCVLVGIDFASFYDFSIGFWNCSDRVVFFFFVLFFNNITVTGIIYHGCNFYRWRKQQYFEKTMCRLSASKSSLITNFCIVFKYH